MNEFDRFSILTHAFTETFILLNIRSSKTYVFNITYDEKLIENEILFLRVTQVSQTEDLSAMQSILEEYTLDHNISSFRYSKLAICYKGTIPVLCPQKNYGTSFFQSFK